MNHSASLNQSATGAPATTDSMAFRTIAEIAGDIAFIVDCPTRTLRYLTPTIETLLGHTPDQVAAQLASDAADGPLAGLCGGLAERLRRFAGGDEGRLKLVREFDVARPDGHKVPVEVISTLVPEGEGMLLVGMIRDLSARRAREAEQKRFASMLNHEFRTPLSTIDGAVQRLEATGTHADEPTRQRYRKIAGAVDRLISMVDEYLSPDRMAALGRQRQPNAIAPAKLLEEASARLREAGRKVELVTAGLPDTLRCEPEGLRLAIKVLVDNALLFSPPGAMVELEGRRVTDGIELIVRDHGEGVPADDLPRIFDRFYRGSNAAGLPGSGLGLYMARSVIEVHGGTLSLAENAPSGAQFRIWLPMANNAGKKVATDGYSSDNRTALAAGVSARKA